MCKHLSAFECNGQSVQDQLLLSGKNEQKALVRVVRVCTTSFAADVVPLVHRKKAP